MTRKPDWSGGCWYDPAVLPKLETGYGDTKQNELVETLCDMSWDVITKSYDAAKDTFIFRRSANRELRVDGSGKTREWKFDINADNLRIVAIMPHPIWQTIYETRMEPGHFAEPTDARSKGFQIDD